MISDLIGSTTEPVIRKRITRVATTMIANAIGRCRTRLSWKSTKSAVAPPTSTVAPAGAGTSRIRSTVDWLASASNGLAEITWTTVTPSSSCCGRRDCGDPLGARIRAVSCAACFDPAPSTTTQIGVSR